MEDRNLLTTTTQLNHRRVIRISLAVAIILSLASAAVLASGTNSKDFSWSDLLMADLLSALFIGNLILFYPIKVQ